MNAVAVLAVAATGCSSSTSEGSRASGPRTHPVPANITASDMPTAGSYATAPSQALPADVERVARGFTTAYAQHDARDGGDRSYADAGARAAKLATGQLAEVLAQKRPGQEAPWAALRAEQARQTVRIISAGVPDGAPTVTSSSALVRVAYALTTTPKSGPSQSSDEQLVVRLEHTADGWRVTALPWA